MSGLSLRVTDCPVHGDTPDEKGPDVGHPAKDSAKETHRGASPDSRANQAPAAEDESAAAEETARPAERSQLKKRCWWVRGIMVAAAAFTAWHVFASFLWIAPAGPARNVIPGDALSNYMLPVFGQSWSVFAPEPINGDNRMFVRAVVKAGDEEITKDWIPVTDIETQMMTHKLFPARAAGQSISLASDYRSAYQKLDNEQQRIAGLNYYNDDWSNRLSSTLKDPVDKNGKKVITENAGMVPGYIEADFRAVRYSTQVARAVWGKDVVRVQYRMERQNVIPFAQRNDANAERPEVQYTPTGWRGIQVAAHQNDEDFAKTFRRLYQQYDENNS
ncbi:MAG: DUF5819 family protein [Galactobacter sp.]